MAKNKQPETINPAERTHSELEKYHYREVANNPFYASEGLMEIRLEELSMNMPRTPDPTLLEERIEDIDKKVNTLKSNQGGKYKPRYKEYL